MERFDYLVSCLGIDDYRDEIFGKNNLIKTYSIKTNLCLINFRISPNSANHGSIDIADIVCSFFGQKDEIVSLAVDMKHDDIQSVVDISLEQVMENKNDLPSKHLLDILGLKMSIRLERNNIRTNILRGDTFKNIYKDVYANIYFNFKDNKVKYDAICPYEDENWVEKLLKKI